MSSSHIKTLLSPPDSSLSEVRALEYLDSNFVAWESLGPLSGLEGELERTRVEMYELQAQVCPLGFVKVQLIQGLVARAISSFHRWFYFQCDPTNQRFIGYCPRIVLEKTPRSRLHFYTTRRTNSCWFAEQGITPFWARRIPKTYYRTRGSEELHANPGTRFTAEVWLQIFLINTWLKYFTQWNGDSSYP